MPFRARDGLVNGFGDQAQNFSSAFQSA
jgi:hypothetical protein